ncbi:hypothetical protein PAXINDRAFT_19058 [Paxillus involutus ATCC 200175]|uniref:Uncharacterized protein n=1 Tax=Paxillus involutus ATCC 200175 TaxID=664439 RepID=A0A0C9TKA7_PAXIN|nr:hypothetical protein PAXINDRAFT_19058 [Paxillus involutus ATCC 200175]
MEPGRSGCLLLLRSDELPVRLCIAPGAPLRLRIHEFMIEQRPRLLGVAQQGIHTSLQIRQLLVDDCFPLPSPCPSMRLPLDQQARTLDFTARNDLRITHEHPGLHPGRMTHVYWMYHGEHPSVDSAGQNFLARALGQRLYKFDHDFGQKIEAGQVRIAGRFRHNLVAHLHDAGECGVSEGHATNVTPSDTPFHVRTPAPLATG